MPSLVELRAGGRRWPLADGTYVVGRAPDCQLVLEDARISRHHARLEVTGASVRVYDLGSSHGVCVNSKRVTSAELKEGDTVAFGPVELRLSARGEHDATLPEAVSGGIIERGSLSAPPPPDSQRLRALYAISRALVASLRLDDTFKTVLKMLDELFHYDRCSIGGRDESGRPITWASRPQGAVPFSRTLVERVLDGGKALLCDDVQGERPFSLGESVIGLNIRSVLSAPLVFRGQIRGMIYLDRSVPGAYSMDDLALLHGVSDLVAVALENARLYADLEARYRQSADRLRKVEKNLIESERLAALGRLTQAFAHEVRNPVSVIGGIARRMARTAASAALGTDLSTILDEAKRLEGVIAQAERVIALPNPSFRLEALERTVQVCLEQCRQLLSDASVSVLTESRLANRPIPHDGALTREALSAILRKSCDAIDRGGTLRVAIGPAASGWSIRASSGGGDEMEGGRRAFFDPYFRTHPWADDMLLALAQAAMARQGGELRVGEDPRGGIDLELVLSADPARDLSLPPRPRLEP